MPIQLRVTENHWIVCKVPTPNLFQYRNQELHLSFTVIKVVIACARHGLEGLLSWSSACVALLRKRGQYVNYQRGLQMLRGLPTHFSPYVFQQSHQLVCLINDLRKLRAHILVLEQRISAFQRPLLSAHAALCRTRTIVPHSYYSTALRQSDYTYQGQYLFIGSFDLEKLLRSVNKSNPLGYGRITYTSYLPTCNQGLYLHGVRYCLLGIVWTALYHLISDLALQDL